MHDTRFSKSSTLGLGTLELFDYDIAALTHRHHNDLPNYPAVTVADTVADTEEE